MGLQASPLHRDCCVTTSPLQAMGGQHNYFGWWLSTEFGKGHCKAKPTSTTFGSPQLSANEDFLIDAVEAWGIGDEPKLDEEEESVSGERAVIFVTVTKKHLAAI